MIYIRVSGRLGNQMFYYAIARKVQLISKQRQELFFDFAGVKTQGRNSKENGFEDTLKNFNVTEYLSNETEIPFVSIKRQGEIAQKIMYFGFQFLMKSDNVFLKKIQGEIQFRLNKFGLYLMNPKLCQLRKTDIIGAETKNIFIDGRYENSGWFNDIRDVLLNEFTPLHEKINYNLPLYNIVENTESVCVSIRRGDYVDNAANEKVFNVCTKEYFEQAINVIKQKLNNPVFILFSDDISWAKKNIHIDGRVYYESGIDPLWEKLRLMYSCKHFIISNSTFSWWAQYLSRNQNKIVISPNIWFKPDITWPLIEDEFIRINVENIGD